jgi:hypothetical protein
MTYDTLTVFVKDVVANKQLQDSKSQQGCGVIILIATKHTLKQPELEVHFEQNLAVLLFRFLTSVNCLSIFHCWRLNFQVQLETGRAHVAWRASST